MANHIKYLNGFLDHIQLNNDDSSIIEIQSVEAELNSLISTFDAMRKAYLSDLVKLRDVYKPGFQTMLSAIRDKKVELEQLTGSKVTFDE